MLKGKRVIAAAVLAVILCGCAGRTVEPEKGDFSFDLPDGYAVSNVTDKNCSIVRQEDSTVVGGIEVTGLKRGDLKNSGSNHIMLYLQNDFHKTNDIEFIASHWGEKKPIVCVNLTRHEEDTEEKHGFSHTFFEKDSCVYHMWFDGNVMDLELESQFLPMTGVDSG